MWDVLWDWMLAANLGDANVGGFAGFGESVVAGVEVLALLQLVLEQILLVGQLAIEAEEALLVCRERADIDLLLLLKRVHRCDVVG